MPGEILGDGESLLVRVENTENGEMVELHPELVVLSTGLEPAGSVGEIAEMLGLPRESTGFFQTLNEKIDTVATIRPGIYLAGTAAAPRDIPDCVAHSGAAAMRAFIDASRDGPSR